MRWTRRARQGAGGESKCVAGTRQAGAAGANELPRSSKMHTGRVCGELPQLWLQ